MVKALYRTFGIAILLGLYLLSIRGAYSNVLSNTAYIGTDTEQGSFYTSASKFLALQTYETEVIVLNLGEPTVFGTEFSFSNFLADAYPAHKSVQFRYTNYLCFSKVLVISFKKTDLIYPFHFFW